MVATDGNESIFIHFTCSEWDLHPRYSIAFFQTFCASAIHVHEKEQIVLKRLYYAFWVLCYVAFVVHVKGLQSEKSQTPKGITLLLYCLKCLV